MPNHIELRQANSDDLEIIISFTHAIHLQEDDGKIPPHRNFTTNLKSWLALELENSLSLFLIAEVETKPVGFIGATTVINDNGFLENPTKGVINLIWVNKENRRKHLAKKLVSTIENCFLENSVNLIECSFTQSNLLANKFWSNAGYEVHSLTARKIISNN